MILGAAELYDFDDDKVLHVLKVLCVFFLSFKWDAIIFINSLLYLTGREQG